MNLSTNRFSTIAETFPQPAENNPGLTTCINFAGGEADIGSVVRAAYHRGCVIRNCYINGAYENGSPNRLHPIKTLTQISGRQWRIETYLPHGRVDGQHFVIFVGEVKKFEDPVYVPSPVFNGTFAIDDIPSDTEIDYTLNADPHPNPILGTAAISAPIQALSADAGIAAVVEGNRVFNCHVGGPYHDTFSSRDLTIRNNYYHNVYAGVFQNLGGLSNPKTGTTLTRSGLTATFTAPAPHGFYTGQAVLIEDALVNSSPINPYNGLFEIKVTGDTTFTYQMTGIPSADASGTFKFSALWQIARITIDKNIIKLMEHPSALYPPPTSIYVLHGGAAGTPYRFPRVVVRDNIVRHVAPTGDLNAFGISINNCGKFVVEKNIVTLARADSIAHLDCGVVRYFENLKSGALLLRGFNRDKNAYEMEVRDQIDDALLLHLTPTRL
jgi:hypothetical protein